MQSLGDHYIEAVYEAVVGAVEEAILNALVAAETTPLIKPSGKEWKAMNHARLKEILTRLQSLKGYCQTKLA